MADVRGASVVVAPLGAPTYYAAIAMFDEFENTAIIPGVNTGKGPVYCGEDLNGNGFVGPMDLVLLLGAWGTTGPAALDDSGDVDAADLSLLLASWGLCE